MKTKMGTLKALDVMKWMLNPLAHRGEGRSHVLMLAYINLAMEYPGTWLTVRDHYPNHLADHFLLKNIQHFVKINFKTQTFRFQNEEFMLVP